MDTAFRPRRTCLSVPASSSRFIAKAAGLPADQVFLDLEDSVAPAAKDEARANAVAALRDDFAGSAAGTGPLVAVRINATTSQWAHRDVISVTQTGGVAAIIVPKVDSPAQIHWLDVLLGQVEQAAGLQLGSTAIEAQIEDAAGLARVEEIAASSPRLAALVFGPADFTASLGMRSLTVGGQPPGYAGTDAYHYALMRLLVAARANGLQAIDGPYARIRDADGLRASAESAAAIGFDGKWVLHPAQIDTVNTAFTPPAEEYARAVKILDAYQRALAVDQRGAVMLDDEMIDEASRKMALAIVAKGRAAGRP